MTFPQGSFRVAIMILPPTFIGFSTSFAPQVIKCWYDVSMSSTHQNTEIFFIWSYLQFKSELVSTDIESDIKCLIEVGWYSENFRIPRFRSRKVTHFIDSRAESENKRCHNSSELYETLLLYKQCKFCKKLFDHSFYDNTISLRNLYFSSSNGNYGRTFSLLMRVKYEYYLIFLARTMSLASMFLISVRIFTSAG